MVEWLLANAQVIGWSLSAYTSQFQRTVHRVLDNQIILWTLVILFIVGLRWLTRPRNNVI
jgi:hypothetical protein